MHDATPLMEMSDISVQFGLVPALKQVNLSIGRHEVLAIVGDNGAGKSTLVKIMSGLIHPTSGTLFWKGKEVSIPTIRAAAQLGIAAVFQSQDFCDNLDVSANLFLGKELTNKHLRRNDEAMQKKSREILHSLSAAIRVGQPMSSLSLGQKQTVSIARTLLNNPDLILLDEPTSSLSVMQTAEILSYIKRMKSEGRSVVMICHDLPDVFAVADRIAVMRQGRLVSALNTAHTSYETIIALLSGMDPGEVMNEQEHRDALTNITARTQALKGTRTLPLNEPREQESV